MKVTEVRAHHLRAELDEPFGWSVHATTIRQALLVEVRTDDGLAGWGESGSGTLPAAGAAFVEEVLAPLVVGRDPWDLQGVAGAVAAAFDRAGWEVGGWGWQAFAGLEVALWDLMGQAAGRPVWQLLGGRARDRVKAYATGLYYYPAAADPTAVREREAAGYVERGYTAMKMKVGGLAPADDVREVERIRAAVGPDVLLMVDANGAYDARTAIRLGVELERLGVAWFEEPVARGDLAGYEEVRRAVALPVAGGEHLGGLGAFRDMVGRRAVDILQPDGPTAAAWPRRGGSPRSPTRTTCACSRTCGAPPWPWPRRCTSWPPCPPCPRRSGPRRSPRTPCSSSTTPPIPSATPWRRPTSLPWTAG